MVISIKQLKDTAGKIFRRRQRTDEIQPVDDIKRETVDNVQVDTEAKPNYRFGSLADHIKKNWVDIKSLNKKGY